MIAVAPLQLFEVQASLMMEDGSGADPAVLEKVR